MRLSDAILLGSTLIEPLAGTVGAFGGPGCAQGMAVVATGDVHNRTKALYTRWPWLVGTPYKLPCKCGWISTSFASVIVHLFDIHVTSGCSERWTIEELSAWVHYSEPVPQENPETVPESELVEIRGIV